MSAATAAVLLLAVAAVAQPPLELHVAPGGDDAAPGSVDQPLATLQGARDLLRRRLPDGIDRDVEVVVDAGTWRQREPLLFQARDGGGAGHAVTYRAAPGARPQLSGAVAVSGWRLAADGNWEATVDLDRGPRQLIVNGRAAVRARHPDRGWLRVEAAGADRRTSFSFAAGALPGWNGGDAAELVFLHDWCTSRVPLRGIDVATRVLTVAAPIGASAPHYAIDHFEPHPRFAVEGAREWLDAPGEWHFDHDRRTLRYRPRAGEAPAAANAVVPVVSSLLRVQGTAEQPVRNLRFVGLSFVDGAVELPERGYVAAQACFHEAELGSPRLMPLGAALHFEHAVACSLDDVRLERLGGSGLWFGRGCHDCVLAGSVIADVGGNGVMIGGAERTYTAIGNVARDNLVERCGAQFAGAVGVWVGLAAGTRVTGNEVRDLPYTGVSLGWCWSPEPTPARDNLVADNHIHHVMQLLSDGGGIYTLGRQPGSALRANWIHDVPLNAGRAESNGVFVDEGSTELLLEDNVIHDVERAPLRFHKAGANLVRRNVLAVVEGQPPYRYNDTAATDIRCEDNEIVGAADARLRAAVARIRQHAGAGVPRR